MPFDNHDLPFNCFCLRDSFCSEACLFNTELNILLNFSKQLSLFNSKVLKR